MTSDGGGGSASRSAAVAAAVDRVVGGATLSGESMGAAMRAILAGEASEAQIAAFAVALRMRGETIEEIFAAARCMRQQATSIDLGLDGEVVLDTCGTGGDGAGTFNVSTVAAIAVAACGVKVAKHGNRAVSSRAGSADVLEALGVGLSQPPDALARCVREVGIGFLYAPAHHGALRHAAPVRRALGVRTFFNLLGPLCNPAGATHQLVGVYDGERVSQLAHVLGKLGCRRAWVVHGDGGLDEISPGGPTRVAYWNGQSVDERTVRPQDFGLDPVGPDALAGGDAATNARIAREVLAGGGGDKRVPVVLNAAAALVVAGADDSCAAAARRVEDALDSGAASRVLDRWIEHTR